MKDKKHIHGFNTPKEYFEDFEGRLFSKISENKIPKESGFSVPKDYFTQLEDRVLERVISSDLTGHQVGNNPKIIPLFTKRTLIYAASIAACAVLIFSVINSNNTSIKWEDMQISSIENYIEEGNLGLDTYDIASLLKENDLENITLENDLFSDETLEDYLLENLDDPTLLIE